MAKCHYGQTHLTYRPFQGDSPALFVAGSTWGPDEDLLIRLIQRQPDVKIRRRTHEMDESRTHRATDERNQRRCTSLYAMHPTHDAYGSRQLLISTRSAFSASVYGYATWRPHRQPGFGVGILATLEAATFGLPVKAFGPNYQKFKEARDLW